MKTIIAGSRDIPNALDCVTDAVMSSGYYITEIISGGARGIDMAGEAYAALNAVPIVRFPADWNKHGKSAGFIRNTQMAEYAQALIAVWDGESRGTKHMIEEARRCGLQIYVHQIKR